jgi:zinc/manganese transport system substrate-binding protein
MRGLRLAFVLPFLAAAFAASPTRAADRVAVIASFSILGDLVRQVGGERVEVTMLVGPDADMHTYQPSPADSRRVLGAQLVVLNGLGLEGWTDRLVKASGYKGHVIVASKGLKALSAADHGHGHGHAHGRKGHAHGRYDPHAWQDIANVKIYVSNIRDALIAVDPGRRAEYEQAAGKYLRDLAVLETEIRAALSRIPKARRRVITSHQAFAYYGDAYEVEFMAPQGVGGDTEPSAKGVAALIRQIKRTQVTAVFVENISNPRLVERIAREAGVRLSGTLYSDALSDAAGPAATYIDMMRHNTRLLADAMK